MAVKTAQKTKKTQSKPKKEISLPLEKGNFTIIAVGVLFLIAGYIFMSENSVDGFLPTVVAPILLVLGYCVIIPYGILKKPSKLQKGVSIPETEENVSAASSSRGVSSNIKRS